MKKTIRTLSSMGFKAASKGDQAFAAMHPVQVVDAHDEKVSKSLEDIANAKGVIPYDRVANKHGYKKGEDEAAYDEFKYSAGGPVVAPVYTKPMHESIRSCPHCGGKACEHCGETGYAITEGEHSNAVVRALRRQQLNEGPRLRALGKTIRDTADFAVGGVIATGASTAMGAAMGNPKLGAIVGGLTSAAMVAGDARQNWKRHKRNELAADKMMKDQKAKFSRVSEDSEVNEGMGLLKTYSQGGHTAKVYRNKDWDEHVVQFHEDGKHLKKADYHTNDRKDAHDTAQHQLKRMCEGVEIEEGFAAAHNALQDRIRDAITSAPSRMKSAVSGFKKKAVATYNDLEDKYQGGPQRRAMQLAQAVKAKKDQQVSRISGKASGYASKAKDLTQYAASHLDKAARLDAEARRTEIPKHNMNQVMSSDEYESRKANIQAATDQKTKLAAASKNHTEKGLSYYDSADAHAARAAKIKDRLDAALAGKSKLLGRGKPKPTAFQSRLKKTARSV